MGGLNAPFCVPKVHEPLKRIFRGSDLALRASFLLPPLQERKSLEKKKGAQ